MRLSVVSILALAGFSVAAPTHNQTQPASTQPSLQGALSQLNSTHVQVNITNPSKQSVALLKRHNLLHAGAEHFSLRVRPKGNSSKSERPGPGDGAVRFIYSRQTGNDSFVRIAAGSHWTHQFDITKSFRIPVAGAYEVSLRGDFHGIYTAANKTNGSDTRGLHRIHVVSKPITCKLSASTRSKQRRGPTDALAGCASQKSQLQSTIKAAADMANDALNALNNADLYKTYFGLVKGQTDTETFNQASYSISRTYGAIASYDPTKDTHITWNCASDKTLPQCRDSVLAYYLYADKSVNLCSGYNTVSKSLACDQPGPSTPALDEQDAVVLHELFHDRTGFAPQLIVDFPDPLNPPSYCYNYQCATKFATDRSSDALPERSAINYEQFAQAARHAAHPNTACVLASGDSSQTPPTPPTAIDANNYGPIAADGP